MVRLVPSPAIRRGGDRVCIHDGRIPARGELLRRARLGSWTGIAVLDSWTAGLFLAIGCSVAAFLAGTFRDLALWVRAVRGLGRG